MKHLLYSILFFSVLWACSGCSSSSSPDPTEEEPKVPPTDATTSLDIENCLVQTSDKKLEIVTWNVEHFPKTATTSKEFAAFVKKMDVDVLALQEIKNKAALDDLLIYLPGYKGVIAVRSDINLAFLYKTSEISLTGNPHLILKDKEYEFAGRPPYVLPIHSKSTNLDIILVNNHLKAFGNEESTQKRIASCRLLKNWVDTYHPTDNVILLGDMNDEITDPKSEMITRKMFTPTLSKNVTTVTELLFPTTNLFVWS